MDSSNWRYANRSPQFAADLAPRQATGEAAAPPAPRRAFRRLQTSQQFLPLLIASIVLTLLVVISAGYVAARSSAISSAQASVRTNVQVAREVIGEHGQYASIASGQLVATGGASSYQLVSDTQVVDHVRRLTGNWTVIYQWFGAGKPALRAIASNLPEVNSQGHAIANSRATGQAMPSKAQAAIFGACSGHAGGGSTCYGEYVGTVTVAGVSYVAAFMPLLDQDGTLVGAVGVLSPLDDVLATPKQTVIMLLSMGLLVGLIVLVVGLWLAGRYPGRLLHQLDSQLDMMALAAAELGRLAHQQQFRLQRQQRTAYRVGEYTMQLESLASAMDDGQSELHKAATAIWEQMSQPGVAINLQTAVRLAREAAVRASEVGTVGEETRQHARQVIALMNQVIAEGRALAQEGQEAESYARDLAATLDRMETDLGEQLVPRRYDLGSVPLIRHITGASQRLRALLQPEEERATESPWQHDAHIPTHTGGFMTDARGKTPRMPLHDGTGQIPRAPLGENPPLSGYGEPGFQSPANPGASGNHQRGWRTAGDAPSSPGWLPPLNRFNDDWPPRGPNDSRWLNG